MAIVSPLEIVTAGPARAAARLFRFDGRLHVAAIAKTRLTLVADGPMRAQEPPDVTAREAVPYRPAADVTFTGQCHVSMGQPSLQTVVRLALLRPSMPGGALDPAETLLNKALGAFEIEGFGPLSTSARHALLPAEERASVDAPLPELRSTTNFAYFHRAPVDQRTVPLRGDEWLWLERLQPAVEHFASQLPMLRAVGAIRLPGHDKPFLMRIDTLTIDGDSGCCDVLARGSFAIASTSDLERLAVIVGFEVGRVSVESAAPAAERGTLVLEPPAAPRERGTLLIEPAADPLPAPERRASTVILEPEEEAAPVTVMASSLDHRTMVDEESAPATRAPFRLIKAGTGRPPAADIPGAPWAAAEAPNVKPAEDAFGSTISPDQGEAMKGELQRRLREAEQARQAEAEKEAAKKAQARKAEPVKWRELPPEQASVPKVPKAPPPKVGAPTAAVKKSLYDRFRKS